MVEDVEVMIVAKADMMRAEGRGAGGRGGSFQGALFSSHPSPVTLNKKERFVQDFKDKEVTFLM